MDKPERDIVMGLVRAEAAAQSKIYAKEIAMQFNAIHESDAQKYDTMAAHLNKLGVMIEVVIDLLIDSKPFASEGLAVNKRNKFAALCKSKEEEMKKARG